MIDNTSNSSEFLTELTASIVGAYVSNNPVPVSELPNVIASVYQSISNIGAKPAAVVEEVKTPAVPIKRSVTPNYLISLEDGKKYQSLKRHLSGLGLTPDEYRAKWGLAKDYPMVSPSYSQRRSELAKKLGLGRKPGAAPKGRASKAKAKA
jgi:predicted transcriptional regulator